MAVNLMPSWQAENYDMLQGDAGVIYLGNPDLGETPESWKILFWYRLNSDPQYLQRWKTQMHRALAENADITLVYGTIKFHAEIVKAWMDAGCPVRKPEVYQSTTISSARALFPVE